VPVTNVDEAVVSVLPIVMLQLDVLRDADNVKSVTYELDAVVVTTTPV
jgi:hypothetical protein